MSALPKRLTLQEWDRRYDLLKAEGLQEQWYGGRLSRHVVNEGDLRLKQLKFDESAAALRLWNFLLTENQRLREARNRGEKLVGTMKDLGTVPVMVYSLPGMRAFYPDGAWWTPCLMECSDRLLSQAEALGIDSAFCPVRAMLPAFENEAHFPRPDLLLCSTGAVCDDFSAIAQRLERRGFPIHWWEMPRRRKPDPGEPARELPGGLRAPGIQVECVASELNRLRQLIGQTAGVPLTDSLLQQGIGRANAVRALLGRLRSIVYQAESAPLPGLEMLVAEMLAIHFCSDIEETEGVLRMLIAEVEQRLVKAPSPDQRLRIFWVNPVADLRVMCLLEDWGGRICGTDYMFAHALDPIPADPDPISALARSALADPMVGPAQDRANRILEECVKNKLEAVVISRIPGASHCAFEGKIIRDALAKELGIPTIELEIPPISDAMMGTIGTRLQALIETGKSRR